jgi:hypothetical protein
MTRRCIYIFVGGIWDGVGGNIQLGGLCEGLFLVEGC